MVRRHYWLCGALFAMSFGVVAPNYEQEKLVFPRGFLKGVARSFYQDGGHNNWSSLAKRPESNWSWFENHKIRFNIGGRISLRKHSPIRHGEKIGNASDGWKRAFRDIALLKKLGCTAQRFSVEWAEIEPQEGVFNEEALSFYERYCDALIANGIKPMITLYHWVHPLWFEKRGGFLQVKNTKYFIRYAKKVFDRLGGKVKLWCTINEPTVISACGYILGLHSAGKVFHFYDAGIVLRNLLNAHVRVYKTLKAMPGGKEAQIGIVHQLLCFEPYRYRLPFGLSLSNPVGKQLSRILNFSFAHDMVKRFLATGVFEYKVVGSPCIQYVDKAAPKSYDFIGLNFYSRIVLGFGEAHYAGEPMTDLGHSIRPDTMYEAIHEMAQLGKPIYITENGLADAKGDCRELFIKSYLGAVHKAVMEGIDVRGYFYWSLLDNFEWSEGFNMKFGLYAVHRKTKARSLRKGSQLFRDYFTIAG